MPRRKPTRRKPRFRGFWLNAEADKSLCDLMASTGASAQTVLALLVKHYAKDSEFSRKLKEMMDAEQAMAMRPVKTPKSPPVYTRNGKPRAKPVTPAMMAEWWKNKRG